MEKEILLAELTKNCDGKKEKLFELLKTYELAELGKKVQDQHFKDIENKVLQENEFLCGRSDVSIRCDDQPRFGERITNERWSFLLSDDDFDRLQATMLPYYVEAGLTDEKGYYITNWNMISCEARNELVSFLINEILPAEIASKFLPNINSIVFQDKLINAFKSSIKPAA